MDCGELSLQNFETDAERDKWLDETRERMGLPKPTEVEIRASRERFRQEIETASIIHEARERGATYMEPKVFVEQSPLEIETAEIIDDAEKEGYTHIDSPSEIH